ncbi:MAG: alkaline phosphatase family protein [Bacteroidota bacterium]|nr:alkaline phosphatase family protein [Bacteroidota bacterium]
MRFSFRTILFFTTITFFGLKISAQPAATERPRLVVGILVDGLQQRHIDLLWNYFDPNGFRKIIGQGANCRDVAYNIVSAGNAPDIASVMTGTTPYYNGITGNYFYNRKEEEIQSIIQDDDQIGIGTDQTLSAHKLLSSTIVDEIMLAYPSKSKSYAIAQGPEEAIMLGGHTANSVAWLDDVNMKWVTTGYYKDGLPHWADEMNVNGVFKNYTARTWGPLYNINTYFSKPNREDKKWGFMYDPTAKKSKKSAETILKNTPSANGLVAELGLKILTEEQLGKDIYPDILLLQFSVRTPFEKTTALQSAEKEDMYLRLDKDIQNILQKIDSKVGLDKTLVFMFGNQTNAHSPNELGENKIPAGYFNADRSLALLSSYLMAIYGQHKWIAGYYGKNIFLNKEKIEERKLNFSSFQQTVADFMLDFEGIQSAFPSSQVFNTGGNASSETARVRNSTNKNCVGDVIITLLPGWVEVDNKNNPVGESDAVISHAPFYFYGWQIKPQNISASYQATDIAPTLSHLLNIPMPNACIGRPIEEMTK